VSKVYLNNYILPNLRYKDIESCLLIQQNQFIDPYTTLGYLEAITSNSLEIVKFKVKNKDSKQILLISNEDCLTLKREKFPNKKLNNFIINSNNVNETGKIIIENNNFLTTKRKTVFFPKL
jgi:sporulation protein YlmC with PRC-barrel domain